MADIFSHGDVVFHSRRRVSRFVFMAVKNKCVPMKKKNGGKCHMFLLLRSNGRAAPFHPGYVNQPDCMNFQYFCSVFVISSYRIQFIR